MRLFTFCPHGHGYVEVLGYDGVGDGQVTVLACGCRPNTLALTWSPDEVRDEAPVEVPTEDALDPSFD